MMDFLIVVILLIIITAAVAYMVKAKKSGVKCIGCPADGGCSGKQKEAPCCSCGCGGEKEDGKAPGCGGGCSHD